MTSRATELTPVWLLAIFCNTDVHLLPKHHLRLVTVYLLKIDLGKKPIILTKLISTRLNKSSPLSSPSPCQTVCQCFFICFYSTAVNDFLSTLPAGPFSWCQLQSHRDSSCWTENNGSNFSGDCTCCRTCLNATLLPREKLFTSGIAKEASNQRTTNTNHLSA